VTRKKLDPLPPPQSLSQEMEGDKGEGEKKKKGRKGERTTSD
jgi:hypothetical protein